MYILKQKKKKKTYNNHHYLHLYYIIMFKCYIYLKWNLTIKLLKIRIKTWKILFTLCLSHTRVLSTLI